MTTPRPESERFEHFVQAQQPMFEQVIRELSQGRKQSHWMWFVFPQLRGLAPSQMSQRYALDSPAEAAEYWQHPVLGPRLRQCLQLVLEVDGRSAEQIFGMPDCLKFHSSLTLFALAAPTESLFKQALQKYFGGELDGRTLELLND